MQTIIGRLLKYNVYDKAANDFLVNNIGYNNIIEIISTYNTLETVMNAANNINEVTNKKLDEIYQDRECKINYDLYNFYSNSIADLL